MSLSSGISGFNKLIGFEVNYLQDGEAELELQVEQKHLNMSGIVHGGVLASLLDSACGASAHSLLPRSNFAPTTNMSISYMNAISEGKIVTKASVLKRGSKMISCEAEARCGALLLAKALVNMQVLERRPSSQHSPDSGAS